MDIVSYELGDRAKKLVEDLDSRSLIAGELYNDGVISGGIVQTSSTLVTTVLVGTYVINGVKRVFPQIGITCTASSDNYVDVKEDGTANVVAVALGAVEPAVTANSVRVAKAVTDGTGVVSVVDMRTIVTTKLDTKADKTYVDSQDLLAVDKTTNQTIGGIKTFSNPLKVANAVNADEAVSKSQLDAKPTLGIATTLEAQTGTDDTKAVSPLKMHQSNLGLGQTWQDVTAGRVNGVTYTNTTGKPIMVILDSSSGYTIVVTVNSVVVDNRPNNASTNNYSSTFIVPSNSTYSVTSNSIQYWSELR